MEQYGDIRKFSSIKSGVCSIMNDLEKFVLELGGGSISDEFVTQNYLQADG